MQFIRVVHYNHTAAISGAERVLLHALPHLREHGIESSVLSPAGALQSEVDRIGVMGYTCYPLQARFTWNPLRLVQHLRSIFFSMRSLRSRLRELRPDLIHANSVRAGIVATTAAAGLRTPVLWHVHDTLPRHPLSVLIRCLAARSGRTSAVAVSGATRRTFAGTFFRKWLSGKTDVLHNSINPLPYIIAADQRAAYRRQLNLSDKFVVGCVGQICTRKNQLALIDIFAEALQKQPNMMLVIVGSVLFPHYRSYEKKIIARIRELGIESSVLLLGSRKDVPSLLAAMDLLAVPSLQEPFPIIVLEAMAASLPVVGYAVDGMPELIADGRTGWLVPPGDAKQMARTILWAEGHPAQRRRLAAAAALARRNDSEAEYAHRLADILRKRSHSSVAVLPRSGATDGVPHNVGGAA